MGFIKFVTPVPKHQGFKENESTVQSKQIMHL